MVVLFIVITYSGRADLTKLVIGQGFWLLDLVDWADQKGQKAALSRTVFGIGAERLPNMELCHRDRNSSNIKFVPMWSV